MRPPGGYTAVWHLLKTGAGDILLRSIAWDAIDGTEYDPGLISFFWCGTVLAALRDCADKETTVRPPLCSIISETSKHYADAVKLMGVFAYKCIKKEDGQWVTIYKGGGKDAGS